MKKLEEKGAPAETIDEFKKGAPAAMKKIIANYDNYDVMMGQSMDGDAMYVSIDVHCTETPLLTHPRHVLIDFREDGVTPYATVWKHGFKETKV